MFFKSIFLSLWFRDLFLIKNLIDYYFREKEQGYLYFQLYWKIFLYGGTIFLDDFRRQFPQYCLVFKRNSNLSVIIPLQCKGLSESKIEEKFILFYRRYQNALGINPKVHIYLQLDTKIQDKVLLEHFSETYPQITLLEPDQNIPKSEKSSNHKTLVISQESLSFIASFLYFEPVYQFVKYKLLKYRLLIDKKVVDNFDQRMKSEFTNTTEKNRWDQWKERIESVSPENLVSVPGYLKNSCNKSSELWIVDHIIENQWGILFWKKQGQQTRHLSTLLSNNVILDYHFIRNKGLIKGSKGEQDSYSKLGSLRKFWYRIKFNCESLWFALKL